MMPTLTQRIAIKRAGRRLRGGADVQGDLEDRRPGAEALLHQAEVAAWAMGRPAPIV